MNLRNIVFWKASGPTPAGRVIAEPAVWPPSLESLPAPAPAPQRSPLQVISDEIRTNDRTDPSTAVEPPRGVMDAPELVAFRTDKYFGHGRHNGAHFRTKEALEQGKQAIVSKFQNILAALLEQRQLKIARLRKKLLKIEGASPVTSERLRLACTSLEREMSVLSEQLAMADRPIGWVLEALNRYEVGFGAGLRHAIDFEHPTRLERRPN